MMKRFQERTGRTSTFGTAGAYGTSGTYGTTGTHGTTGTYGTTGTHGTRPFPSHPTGTSTPSLPPSEMPRSRYLPPASEDSKERMKGTDFNPLPFDAKKAPTPDLCLLKFAHAARAATKIEELMPYIPYAKLKVLKECQAQYDPALAAQRRAEYQAKGMDQDGIDHLTASPYAGELKRLKSLGEKIMRVKNIKYTKSNKAELHIATQNNHFIVNGASYPYGTAEVEMLGEGNYWFLESYNDNNIGYKEPQ